MCEKHQLKASDGQTPPAAQFPTSTIGSDGSVVTWGHRLLETRWGGQVGLEMSYCNGFGLNFGLFRVASGPMVWVGKFLVSEGSESGCVFFPTSGLLGII